jgi:hypothetical protein
LKPVLIICRFKSVSFSQSPAAPEGIELFFTADRYCATAFLKIKWLVLLTLNKDILGPSPADHEACTVYTVGMILRKNVRFCSVPAVDQTHDTLPVHRQMLLNAGYVQNRRHLNAGNAKIAKIYLVFAILTL